jgi:hypothetical protein
MISVLIFLTVCASLIRVPSVKAENSSFFSEHFDGSAIDTSKWRVQEQNVDLSGNPAWGGNATVTNSYLYMSSNGSAFPFIQTVDNPFPTSGDFILQFSLQYTTIADWGDGLMLGNGTPTLDQTFQWHNKIFDVWAADKGPESEAHVYIELLNNQVYEVNYSGFKPTSPVQKYELAYVNGVYHVYVNGNKVAQAQSDVRPTTIIIGEPPIFCLPESPENVAVWGFWGWSSFQMDYVNIQQSLDGVGTTTPSIAVFCRTFTTASNFKVEISGTLTMNEIALANVPILLSYSVDGGNYWNELTNVGTDNNGNFLAVWLPSVSGNYLLRAELAGNANYSETSKVINFALAPSGEQNVFSVMSNSTISALAFNSTSEEIDFTVSGPSNTTGYADVYIPKSLISEVSNLRVFLDGTRISYNTQSSGDSWLVTFTYHHSTHKVTMDLNTASSTKLSITQLLQGITWGVSISIIVTVVFFLFLRKNRGTKT